MYKIHYHTKADFFSGAENMIANFLSSVPLKQQYDITFSYVQSVPYEEGLKRRVSVDFPIYPIHFRDPSNFISLLDSWPTVVKRGISFISRVLFALPSLIYHILSLRRLFVKLGPDLIHINSGGYPASLSARAAAIAAKMAGISNVVMVVNNLAVGYNRPSRWFGYPLDRLVARSVSMFVTGSSVATAQLKRVLRLTNDRCRSLYNGICLRPKTESVEESRQRLGVDGFDGVILGVVAILQPNKGHLVLLESIKALLNAEPEYKAKIKLLIEGSGPSRPVLEGYIEENNLGCICRLVGCESNVMNFMNILDVLVLPSVGLEDFPNVIIEAMGLGKPVIASRIAGTPEQVKDGVSGLLVKPGSVSELSDAIRMLCDDSQLRLKMGNAGLKIFLDNFTAEVAVDRYMKLYQSLIDRSVCEN